MKKIFLGILTGILMLSLVLAVKPTPAADNGLNGKGKVSHLYLFEKDPTTWMIVEGGAWGKMTYNVDKETFVFNGHGLEAGTDYTLIYYPDPWPGENLDCITDPVMADEYGNVHIAEYYDFDMIPITMDENLGAKIWLVLSDDVDCSISGTSMIGWNPTEYLFEYNLI